MYNPFAARRPGLSPELARKIAESGGANLHENEQFLSGLSKHVEKHEGFWASLGKALVEKVSLAAKDPVRFGLAYALLQVPGIGDREAGLIVNKILPTGGKPFSLPVEKNPNYDYALRTIVAQKFREGGQAPRSEFASLVVEHQGRFPAQMLPMIPAGEKASFIAQSRQARQEALRRLSPTPERKALLARLTQFHAGVARTGRNLGTAGAGARPKPRPPFRLALGRA